MISGGGGFNEQLALQKQRYAQIAGGGVRGNAPKTAATAQGGQGSGAVATMAPLANEQPTPMNPMIPGVPPVFASSGVASGVAPLGAAPAVTSGQYAGTPQGRYDSSGDGKPSGLDRNVGQYQNYLSEGVRGYADIAGQDLRKSIGETLGGLNGIGALRSGAVQSGINDLVTNYGRQIGDYASMTATEGAKLGQTENDLEVERKRRDEADRRSRRGGFLRGVGTLLGGGIGLITGGPAGAMAGAKAANEFTGLIGG